MLDPGEDGACAPQGDEAQMIQRHKPLKRSMKPIKRSPLKRKARKPPTAGERRYMKAVAALGCIVCRLYEGAYSIAGIHCSVRPKNSQT